MKLTRFQIWFAVIVLASAALPGYAQDRSETAPRAVTTMVFRGHAFEVRSVGPRVEDLRLFWAAPTEKPMHDFIALEARVRAEGERLIFAANAGMFQPDSSPVGLLVIDGREIAPLNLQEGKGNFYLKPNGVFALTEDRRGFVMESSSFATFLPKVQCATQSGPLLVHQGEINPELIEGSLNWKVRSGVGVRKDGTVVFALSRGTINFYDFAAFFLLEEKCPNAVYLDGDISDFHTEGEAEKAGMHSFGPMFGIVRKE